MIAATTPAITVKISAETNRSTASKLDVPLIDNRWAKLLITSGNGLEVYSCKMGDDTEGSEIGAVLGIDGSI